MNIFLLGATPEITLLPKDDHLVKLGKTGGNTGNQIIALGLLARIQYQNVSWDYGISPHEVKEKYDLFVIAAANFLFHNFDFGGMADYIERADLPVAIVGLGAQANNYDPDIRLHPGTERFLKVIAERAVSIGIRGPFTGEVLSRRGIHNFTITGCPSYYMAGAKGLHLRKREFHNIEKICVNASRDVINHAFNRDKMSEIVREIYREAIIWQADFIAQSEHAEITLAEKRTGPAAEAALNDICSFLQGIADNIKIREWALEHIRVCFNVDDWVKVIRTYDFVFGNRFHGNIVALQEGVPACVICHDTRTEEMCEFLGLPHVNIVDVKSIEVKMLFEQVDSAGLNDRYNSLYPRYLEFLRKNKLTPRE